MKTCRNTALGLLLTVLLASFAAQGQQKEGQKPAPLALVGTWKLDLAKSQYKSGPPPKLINLHYWWWEGDSLHHEVERLNAEGKVEAVAGHWFARYDSPNHLYGDEGDSTVSMTRIDEHTTEMTESYPDGRPASRFRQVVSKDGKTLTITGTRGGSTIADVMVHDRQ
jgi:hypothetical protein